MYVPKIYMHAWIDRLNGRSERFFFAQSWLVFGFLHFRYTKLCINLLLSLPHNKFLMAIYCLAIINYTALLTSLSRVLRKKNLQSNLNKIIKKTHYKNIKSGRHVCIIFQFHVCNLVLFCSASCVKWKCRKEE